ncbi:MAG: tRNA pseudouridine(38-40) synthase TruA [Methanomassiliicoccales archaeon]|nr:tRNA pseudouridine(38-40) synthase TruA [Methanomassiliicoccales archaeon]NYT15092.1 tRNA pseudouridine(38-40) synthase TruA [Methanomassiliicoccales archaeon]
MVWRAAVKIAYDGRSFMGSQRQPDRYTVEGEVIRSIQKIEAVDSLPQSRFKAASRTDRGVSALGNVVAFDTDFDEKQLIRALNGVSSDVYYYGLAKVPTSFSPRRASVRWYRYVLPSEGIDVDMVLNAASLLQGKHDFRSFCKNDDRTTVRVLNEARVLPLGSYLVIDFKAREFLRNMVRRMVAALESVGTGNATISEVEQVLEGDEFSFGLADPKNLCLMDIEYQFDFEIQYPKTLKRKIIEKEEDAFLRLDFYRELAIRCLPVDP